MRPRGVIACYPVLDDTSSLEAVGDFFEINRLRLQRPPQPFDEDTVEVPASTVHRDARARVGQRRDPS